jgi:hypothetical protein
VRHVPCDGEYVCRILRTFAGLPDVKRGDEAPGIFEAFKVANLALALGYQRFKSKLCGEFMFCECHGVSSSALVALVA